MALVLNDESNDFFKLIGPADEAVVVFDSTLSIIHTNEKYRGQFREDVLHLRDIVGDSTLPNVDFLQNIVKIQGSWRATVVSTFCHRSRCTIRIVVKKYKGKSYFIGHFVADPSLTPTSLTESPSVDELTTLPNRYAFLDCVEQRLLKADQVGHFAVLYIDLDHFKDINELYGHSTGDAWLQLCARNIQKMLRAEDVLARFSGDEFAVLVDCKESHEAQYLCHRLIRFFERPIIMSGTRYQIPLSIGVAFCPEQGNDPQTLVMNAEKAMFSAKSQGRGQYQLFDREQSQRHELHQRLAEAMRYVLNVEPTQFYAVYQPLYRIVDGDFLGVEVLARWHSVEFGDVSPMEFIGIAESRGMINDVTASIFSAVERDLFATEMAGRSKAPILAINVSAQQVGHADFESLLIPFFHKAEQAGWQLELELTESQLMSLSNKLVFQLESWREMGIRIAIDDFGTGYSCLAYLHTLPIDKVKIDRHFLQTQTDSGKEDQVLYAIMSMVSALEMEVLVEGIETYAQFERMQALGCDAGQGFGLAEPSAWHSGLMNPLFFI